MQLTELYNIAEKSGIRVDDFKLDENTQSLAIYFDDMYAIAIDISKLNSNAEIMEALAHELGHCKTHSLYQEDHHKFPTSFSFNWVEVARDITVSQIYGTE